MRRNPAINPIVPILESPFSSASGISSPITTYTIAPAAKAKSQGMTGAMLPTKRAVANPAIGSTIPEALPLKKAFHRLNPLCLKGMETAAPSGKFCIPMPMARAIADAIAIEEIELD